MQKKTSLIILFILSILLVILIFTVLNKPLSQKNCQTNYACFPWSECNPSGNQSTTCWDVNSCNSTRITKEQSCEFILKKQVGPFDIAIKGDNNCKEKTNNSLNLLKITNKSAYDYVKQYVGIIECVKNNSRINVFVDPPTFFVGDLTSNADYRVYASTFIHEACHSQLYSDYLNYNSSDGYVPAEVYSGEKAEYFCAWKEYDILKELLKDADDYDKKVFLEVYHPDNLIKSRWWEVKDAYW